MSRKRDDRISLVKNNHFEHQQCKKPNQGMTHNNISYRNRLPFQHHSEQEQIQQLILAQSSSYHNYDLRHFQPSSSQQLEHHFPYSHFDEDSEAKEEIVPNYYTSNIIFQHPNYYLTEEEDEPFETIPEEEEEEIDNHLNKYYKRYWNSQDQLLLPPSSLFIPPSTPSSSSSKSHGQFYFKDSSTSFSSSSSSSGSGRKCSTILFSTSTDKNSSLRHSKIRFLKKFCFLCFLLISSFFLVSSLLQQTSLIVLSPQGNRQHSSLTDDPRSSSSSSGSSSSSVYIRFSPSSTTAVHDQSHNNGDGGEPSSVPSSNDDATTSSNVQQLLSAPSIEKPQRRLPQCIIIGARKCGTRALIDMLNLHPQVEKAPMEVHFFDRDDNYSKGLEWYRQLMPETYEDQIGIEKSPSYFVTPEVPERIHGMNSSIKLLLIVREPVIRVISDYTQIYGTIINQNSTTNISSSSTFLNSSLHANKSTSPPPRLEDLVVDSDGSINIQYKAVRISLYSRYLQRWLDVFPLSQIHVIDGEALIRDPYSVLKDVESFLGLQPRLHKDNFYFNSTKGFYCWRKLVDNDNSSESSSSNNYLSSLSSTPNTTNNNIISSSSTGNNNNNNNNNNFNSSNLHCLNESKGRPHPNVDKHIISKLRKFYSSHNLNFYEMVGKDFGWPEE